MSWTLLLLLFVFKATEETRIPRAKFTFKAFQGENCSPSATNYCSNARTLNFNADVLMIPLSNSAKLTMLPPDSNIHAPSTLCTDGIAVFSVKQKMPNRLNVNMIGSSCRSTILTDAVVDTRSATLTATNLFTLSGIEVETAQIEIEGSSKIYIGQNVTNLAVFVEAPKGSVLLERFA